MSLRARLICAFFLLAVVPLCGVTLSSYLTTEKAYRRAVEVEAAALAEEMNGRLASVTRDLDRRLGGLRELPFGALAASKDQPEARDKLLADVRSQIGDAAPLVETLEFRPSAPEPAASPAPAPKPAARHGRPAPRPYEAPKTIVMAPDAAPAAAGASPPPEPPHWVLWHQRAVDAAAAVGEEMAREAKRAEQEISREHTQAEREAARARSAGEREKTLAESTAERDARLQKMREDLQQRAARAGELVLSGDEKDKREGARIIAETTAMVMRHVGEALVQGKKDFAGRFRSRFDYTVKHDGADVGTVRAQVKPQELLASVFARTRRRQGEMPFAIDDEGQLYAAGSDRGRLESLRVAAAVQDEKKGGVLKVKGDWVVVAHRDPDSGLTLGIARPLGEGLKELRGAALKNLSYGLLMTGLALVGTLPLSRRLTRDVQALTEGATRLAHGDLDARVSVRSKDEVGRLAEAFNRMAADLRTNQEQLVQQARLRRELELGRRIQEEMLPHDRLRMPFAEAKGLSIPAREVGGDFFNYFLLDDGRAALVVGDVSGKGVGAALLMANLQATLRARMPLEKDLTTLARHLDAEIDQQTTANYLTAFIGVLEGNRVMRYVNCGHNPPLVLRKGSAVEALDSTGRPLGLLPGGDYEERQVVFDEGDWLFLYTDGVVDSENEQGEPFGAERLQRLLVAEGDSGLDGVLSRVEQAVREYRGGREAADDATLVVLRVGPSATS